MSESHSPNPTDKEVCPICGRHRRATVSGSGKTWVFKKNQCACAATPPEEAPESPAAPATDSPTASSTETPTATQPNKETDDAAPKAAPEQDSKTDDASPTAEAEPGSETNDAPQADPETDDAPEAELESDSKTDDAAPEAEPQAVSQNDDAPEAEAKSGSKTDDAAPEAEPQAVSQNDDAPEAEPESGSKTDDAAPAADSPTEPSAEPTVESPKAFTDTGEIPVYVAEPATTAPDAQSSDPEASTETPSSETDSPAESVSTYPEPEELPSTPESPPAEPDRPAGSDSPSENESPGESESQTAEPVQRSESSSSPEPESQGESESQTAEAVQLSESSSSPEPESPGESESQTAGESDSSDESEPAELDSIVCTVESQKGQPLGTTAVDSGTWARSPRTLPELPQADPLLQNSPLIRQPQLHVPPELLVGSEPSPVASQQPSSSSPPVPVASPQPPINSPQPPIGSPASPLGSPPSSLGSPSASLDSSPSSLGSPPSIGSPPASILSNSATFSTSSTFSPSGAAIPPAEPPIVNGSWVSLTNIRADDVSTPPRSFKALPQGKHISSAAKDVLSSTVSEIKSGAKGSGKKTNDYSMPSSSRHLILSAKESVKNDLRAKGISVGKDYGSFPSDSVEMTTSLPKEPDSKVVDDLLPPNVVQSGTSLGTTSGGFTSSSNSGVRSTTEHTSGVRSASGYSSGVRSTSGANHDLIITSGPALTSTSSGTSIMSTTSATGLNYEDMSSGVRSATGGGADPEQDAHWVPVTKKSREKAQSHFKHDSELLNLVHPVEKTEEHDPSTTRKTIMEAFRRTKIKSLVTLVIAIAIAWVGYQYISTQAIANKRAQLNSQLNAQNTTTKPKPTTHTPQHKSVRTTKKPKRNH